MGKDCVANKGWKCLAEEWRGHAIAHRGCSWSIIHAGHSIVISCFSGACCEYVWSLVELVLCPFFIVLTAQVLSCVVGLACILHSFILDSGLSFSFLCLAPCIKVPGSLFL